LSARAAAQLEFLNYTRIYHYPGGKADWIVRGLPTEPLATAAELIRALPYFVNIAAPGIRAAWIRMSRRRTVIMAARDDLPRLPPDGSVSALAGKLDARPAAPLAVALLKNGTLLGSIETVATSAKFAVEAINPAPQTIRPDMTNRLAARLLREHQYILVTDACGVYLGRYATPRRPA
jgi:hypothetical protein